jgi:hypothetical protein
MIKVSTCMNTSHEELLQKSKLYTPQLGNMLLFDARANLRIELISQAL